MLVLRAAWRNERRYLPATGAFTVWRMQESIWMNAAYVPATAPSYHVVLLFVRPTRPVSVQPVSDASAGAYPHVPLFTSAGTPPSSKPPFRTMFWPPNGPVVMVTPSAVLSNTASIWPATSLATTASSPSRDAISRVSPIHCTNLYPSAGTAFTRSVPPRASHSEPLSTLSPPAKDTLPCAASAELA